MAGQGAAADPQGNLYLVTGNGDFDGSSQWGESFLKLKYTPPSGQGPASLKVIDHWTPWTDLARSGGARASRTKLAGVSAPSEAMRPVNGGMPLKNAKLKAVINDRGVPTLLVFPNMANGAWSDEDWGSAGPACIFSIGVCIAAGKDGIAYPIKTSLLGGTTLNDLANPKNNCAKLAAPPVWLTMSPGPVDPCPNDHRTLNFFPWGDTAHLHMTPVQFFDPELNSWTIFAWSENSQLHKWSVGPTGKLSYVAESKEYASADVRGNPPGGMPGGFCCGSRKGSKRWLGESRDVIETGRALILHSKHPKSKTPREPVYELFGAAFGADSLLRNLFSFARLATEERRFSRSAKVPAEPGPHSGRSTPGSDGSRAKC